MPHDATPAAPTPQLCQRYSSLVWSCLDADLHKTALFYAERYYVLDTNNHDARHLYATALLQAGQPHSAHHLTNVPLDKRCTGCVEIIAKCCAKLGRHRQAREALETCLQDPAYMASQASSSRAARFSDEAVLWCQAGNAALKGNQHQAATTSYLHALRLNPMLWEAFEGLCAIGDVPPVDNILPERSIPTSLNFGQGESSKSIPVATGAGFFTPEAGSSNFFNDWMPGQLAGPRDSIATNDSSFYGEPSFVAPIRASRSQPTNMAVQPPAVRPLSSADEAGPVTKKLRALVRQRKAPPAPTDSQPALKSSKSAGKVPAAPPAAADRPKSSKARARPAPTIANIFSSPRRSNHAVNVGKPGSGAGGTRRSSRLQSGGSKLAKAVRDRRRVATKTRSQSHESLLDEESELPAFAPASGLARDPTPPPAEEPPTQEEYEMEVAECEIYDVMRNFARATLAMSLYDCRQCLEELEALPAQHKRSASVMAMLGKAHYELGQYPEAERAFEAARNLEPYRLWDMEVYSTLLWHLQRNVRLSFLAQELLSTDSKSPQAWIAVGNCFSLQKEKAQALTCFRRASQLDPTCAYAYTLSGHESIDEDMNKAITFFQSALRADARHYNAWYGLGTCYMRMSKLRLAEYHFKRAAAIHPQNAVLLGCVGVVHERYGDYDKALELFNTAIALSPDNALVRYHRAKILIAMKNYAGAAVDLEHLRDTSPDESNVLFQLARAYRLMGHDVKFTQLLAEVRDVAPKSAAKIRKLVTWKRMEARVRTSRR
ncbi:protein prenylyltransferase [Epithele typhae]|uniref:protein prenylyltransferase n=1 Tax=Epithele typhae TaxID=378194 RepID=UPI002008E34A|nr:protein prenylyltransferase [Epithele typhae]KAH9946284.1 protein prenylyltransferase [Epithele typhae]